MNVHKLFILLGIILVFFCVPGESFIIPINQKPNQWPTYQHKHSTAYRTQLCYKCPPGFYMAGQCEFSRDVDSPGYSFCLPCPEGEFSQRWNTDGHCWDHETCSDDQDEIYSGGSTGPTKCVCGPSKLVENGRCIEGISNREHDIKINKLQISHIQEIQKLSVKQPCPTTSQSRTTTRSTLGTTVLLKATVEVPLEIPDKRRNRGISFEELEDEKVTRSDVSLTIYFVSLMIIFVLWLISLFVVSVLLRKHYSNKSSKNEKYEKGEQKGLNSHDDIALTGGKPHAGERNGKEMNDDTSRRDAIQQPNITKDETEDKDKNKPFTVVNLGHEDEVKRRNTKHGEQGEIMDLDLVNEDADPVGKAVPEDIQQDARSLHGQPNQDVRDQGKMERTDGMTQARQPIQEEYKESPQCDAEAGPIPPKNAIRGVIRETIRTSQPQADAEVNQNGGHDVPDSVPGPSHAPDRTTRGPSESKRRRLTSDSKGAADDDQVYEDIDNENEKPDMSGKATEEEEKNVHGNLSKRPRTTTEERGARPIPTGYKEKATVDDDESKPLLSSKKKESSD